MYTPSVAFLIVKLLLYAIGNRSWPCSLGNALASLRAFQIYTKCCGRPLLMLFTLQPHPRVIFRSPDNVSNPDATFTSRNRLRFTLPRLRNSSRWLTEKVS